VNKLLRLGVSAVLLTWIGLRTDWSTVQTAFANLRIEFWLAAVLLLTLSQIASALRWKCFADHLGIHRSLPQLTGLYFVGMYFNLMLPTSVGGDVVRAWYLRAPGRRLAAFASVLLDRLSGLMVLVALACASVTLAPLDLPAWMPIALWSMAAAGLLGLLCLPIVKRLPRLRHTRLDHLARMLEVMKSPKVLLPTTLVSLFVQVASVLLVWMVGLAIQAPVPVSFYWIMVPMISLLTLLPVSINGMGVREGAAVLLLTPFGVEQGTALTLAFLWFAVYAAVSLMGGVVYLTGRFAKPEMPADVPTEVDHGPIGGDPDQGRAGQHRSAA
jgi:glycosyltransferase 2 family protein